jgi:hypothetical protein
MFSYALVPISIDDNYAKLIQLFKLDAFPIYIEI